MLYRHRERCHASRCESPRVPFVSQTQHQNIPDQITSWRTRRETRGRATRGRATRGSNQVTTIHDRRQPTSRGDFYLKKSGAGGMLTSRKTAGTKCFSLMIYLPPCGGERRFVTELVAHRGEGYDHANRRDRKVNRLHVHHPGHAKNRQHTMGITSIK